MITETYPPSEPLPSISGLVLLVKTLRNGDTVEEWLTPLNALLDALYSPLNGSETVSSHITWGAVSSGTSDASGSALCVEWSSIRNRNDFVT